MYYEVREDNMYWRTSYIIMITARPRIAA
eukprot:SAG11_NODE_37019_length_258_cov_8.138365_1_plen_28_part_10